MDNAVDILIDMVEEFLDRRLAPEELDRIEEDAGFYYLSGNLHAWEMVSHSWDIAEIWTPIQ